MRTRIAAVVLLAALIVGASACSSSSDYVYVQPASVQEAGPDLWQIQLTPSAAERTGIETTEVIVDIVEGAERSGRTPDRKQWRLVREIYIGETDEKAQQQVRDGAIGRCWREYLLPFYVGNGFVDHFKVDPSHADSEVTVDYLVEKSWFVGSTSTVIEPSWR